MLDGILDEGLQGEARQLQVGQVGRDLVDDGQPLAKAGLLNLQVGEAVLLLLPQGGHAVLTLEIVAKEAGEVQQQLPRPARIPAGDGADGVEGVEQEVRVDLRLHQLELGLHQQALLLLQPSAQQLLGEQVGDPFSQGVVDLEKQPLLGFIQLDGADHPLITLQGDHQHRAQLALGGEAAAIGLAVAVGKEHLVLGDGLQGDGGGDGSTRLVVILPGADEGEDLVGIRDGDRADPGLLLHYLGDAGAGLGGEPLAHDADGTVGDGEGLGGEDPGELLVHPLLVADHADEEGRPAGVGQDHGGGDGAHQEQGLVERGGDQQDDHHLHDLGHEGREEGDSGLEEVIHPARPHQPPVHQPPRSPSQVVEMAQARSVKPPRV